MFLPRKTNTFPENQWLGRCIFYWHSPFLGDMLVLRGVRFVGRLCNLCVGFLILYNNICSKAVVFHAKMKSRCFLFKHKKSSLCKIWDGQIKWCNKNCQKHSIQRMFRDLFWGYVWNVWTTGVLHAPNARCWKIGNDVAVVFLSRMTEVS